MSQDPQDMDFGAGEDVDIPDDPGPAVAGKTPILGSLRRNNGIPVARDELGEEFEDFNADDLSDEFSLGLL